MTHDHRTSDDTRYDTTHDDRYDDQPDTHYAETDHVVEFCLAAAGKSRRAKA